MSRRRGHSTRGAAGDGQLSLDALWGPVEGPVEESGRHEPVRADGDGALEQVAPAAGGGIPDPVSFFSTLGLDVARQIDQLSDRLAGEDRPGETHLQKIGRLREARMTAESDILRQEVLLAPEGEDDDRRPWPAPTPWISMTEDPNDPIWQQDMTYLRENNQT